jgi:hypothetical protein
MNDAQKIDDETKQLAAMAYGESSTKDVKDEIYAIASVLARQKIARGYSSITKFATEDKTFSFVVRDGNPRYEKLMKSSDKKIMEDSGMAAAIEAAKNALADGPDLSGGAYFWDGADIKTNYRKHFKVLNGIKFTSPDHNIYGIEESIAIVIKWKTVIKRRKGKIISKEQVEVGRYDHVYESTAAFGGTIFWKHNPDYMKLSGAKAYK